MPTPKNAMVNLLGAVALNVTFWSGVHVLVARRTGFGGIDRMLATAVAGFVAIVLSLELLSFAGLINSTSVAVVCLGTGLTGLWVWRHRPKTQGHDATGGEVSRSSETRSRSALALCAIGLAGWAALVYLLLGLTFPVEVISDAPIYHLPFAIAWWKAGTITLVPTPFGESAATYYPANADLWLAWLTASGSAALAKVGQWPFMVVGAGALYGLARLANTPPAAAVIPAALWIGLPVVVMQSHVANVDLVWTSFYLIAVYFLVRWLADDGPDASRLFFLFALSCGVVIGSKAVGAVFVALLLPVAFASVMTRRQPVRQLAGLCAGLCVPSAYWYVRNAVLTGNPVYPLELSAFNHVFADGWYRASAMDATAYHLPEAEWRTLLARLELVAGRGGVALLGAGMLIGWVQWVRPTVPLTAGRALAGYSTLALAQGVIYWFVVPYNTQERFLLPAFGLALVPLATVAALHPILHAALCLSLAWQLVGRTGGWQDEWFTVLRVYDNPLASGDMRVTLLLPLSIAAALLVLRYASRARHTLAALILLTGCVFSARPAATLLVEQSLLQFYPRSGFAARLFPGWEIVEHAASPNGSRIAYAGTNLPYYLLGTALRNEVHYVNTNEHQDWLPHDYHRERIRTGERRLSDHPFPQWERTELDFDAWVANLRSHQIDLLFIARENRHGRLETGPDTLPPFPIERRWADAHAELFVDLGPFQVAPGTIPWVRVYRLMPAP